MRITYLLGLILVVASCSIPRSYVNSIPKTSYLEEKGDWSVSAISSETSFGEFSTYQFNAAWSPIERWGIIGDYTLYDEWADGDNLLEIYKNFDLGVVYYIPTANQFNYEFQLGYGQGKVLAEEEFIELADIISYLFLLESPDEYRAYSKFNRLFVQANANTYTSDHAHVSVGVRLQRVRFSEYFYESGDGIYKTSFTSYVFDPFISNTLFLGKVGFNMNLSYSLLTNERLALDEEHPSFKKTRLTLGLVGKF